MPVARLPGRVRLQRLLAGAGFGSRRSAEALIKTGRVSVNGKLASLGDSADPSKDVVALDGERLRLEALAYWIVNKPRGVLTTVRDPEGRRTILDLLPQHGPRMFPVGRLDLETEGLVLLTNDGALTHAMLHPSHEIEREYVVTVRGELSERAQKRLSRGMRLEDGVTARARVERVRYDEDDGTTTFHLILIEGRKRQIRRAMRALGHPVRALCRIRMGPLRLGKMKKGAARPATAAEIAALGSLRLEAVEASPDAQGARRSASKSRARKGKRTTRPRRAARSVSN